MTKALFCIVPDGFRDEEYSVPKRIFEEQDISVVTASTVLGMLTGKKGLTTARVDILLDQADAKEYACIVIVGGQKTFWHNPKLIELIKQMNAEKKAIGAICSSAVLPAQAELMRGKKGTVFPGKAELLELEKYGVVYTAASVEIAGNIITADGPEAAEKFSREVLNVINKNKL